MLTLLSIGVPLIVGAIAAWLARTTDLRNVYRESLRITKPEFVVGAIVVTGLGVLVTLWIGPSLARNSAINGYHEFYNGSVTEPVVLTDTCSRDGSCEHHYTCDHEEIYHPAVYGSKGEVISAAYTEDVYHQCPYATRELSYVLDTNIGKTITIATGYFEAHPQEWRGGS